MKPAIAAFAFVFAIAAQTACTGQGKFRTHPLDSAKLWKQYEGIPDERALAIAGDPISLWVGGAAGGFKTVTRAKYAALSECKKKRIRARIQQPCRIYAVGEEIVWIFQ